MAVSPEPTASESSKDLISEPSNNTRRPVTKGLLDANVYATKKTIAQGMLDVALLTANASQLKYLLQIGSEHEFYYLMMTLISLSIVLQILSGVFFVVLGYLDVNDVKQQRSANILNNVLTISVFIITIDNILISAFGMKFSDDIYVEQG